SASDFASLDESQLTAARLSNGELPDLPFLHLVSGSDLIDRGTKVVSSLGSNGWFRFGGSAPDLGRFDVGLVAVPNARFQVPLVWTNAYNPNPTNAFWIFTGASGNGSGITANGGTLANANPRAPEGIQSAFVQGTSSVSQAVIGFTAGATYELVFSAAQRK